jgi:hypothetical protein
VRKVAFVGTHVPRQCGIATFTHDLSEAVAAAPGYDVSVAAVTDAPGAYAYPPRVRLEIAQHEPGSYRCAATLLRLAAVDLVCLYYGAAYTCIALATCSVSAMLE